MDSHILDITTLSDLMHHNARKLLSAEKQLENMIPLWVGETRSSSLVTQLNSYLALVRVNIKELQQYLNEEGIGALSCTNRIMQDMILESRETMSNCTNNDIKETTLHASVLAISHYKTALYNHLAACATHTGNPDAVRLFASARLQEEDIVKHLSQTAMQAFDKSIVNTVQPQKYDNVTKC